MTKEKEVKKETKVSTKKSSIFIKKDKTKKVVTKDSKKNEKKGTAKQENKKRVSVFKKIASYFKGIKQEMSKSKWPSKKDMLLYSGATLGFMIIFTLFFSLNDIVISAVKQLVR